MRKSKWQDLELQRTLARLSASGLSAAQIAEQLGETKNAVALAMHRYGLFANPRPTRWKVEHEHSHCERQ